MARYVATNQDRMRICTMPLFSSKQTAPFCMYIASVIHKKALLLTPVLITR